MNRLLDILLESSPASDLRNYIKKTISESGLKKGHTHQSGDRSRHILDLDQLQTIADHAVDIIFDNKTMNIVQNNLNSKEAHDMYVKLKEESINQGLYPKPDAVYRVIDDYYDEPLSILKFYQGISYTGGKIRSRSMMDQYRSRGAQHVNKPENAFQGDPKQQYTPKKAGGLKMKNARRHISKTRTSDEIIIYAAISRGTNRFTKERSQHTGDITLYVFLIDRNFE